jgi:omega-6 fatty acid desaturase (delta-12 desaturase)
MTICNPAVPPPNSEGEPAAWSETITKYKQPNHWHSAWQVVNTFVPFAGFCWLMHASFAWSYWLTLLLAIPTAGLVVRIFTIQHDCGHHSFFRSRNANDLLGFVCGVITLTPYHFWRRTHARHHTTSGNLTHRGHGDVLTLTVEEYRNKSRRGRLAYRLYRNPFVMFFVLASYFFIIRQRFTTGIPRTWNRERKSVYATNLGILFLFVLAHYTIGATTLLLLWLPVAVLGGAAGSWLFFVQHQFEDAYWHPHQSWDFTSAALEGSSFYRLPPVLQWLTGNIGFHHIHHLNSRIPNYNLPACYEAEPAFREGPTFGLADSLKCASLKLWDEDAQRMVGFADVNLERVVSKENESPAKIAA